MVKPSGLRANPRRYTPALPPPFRLPVGEPHAHAKRATLILRRLHTPRVAPSPVRLHAQARGAWRGCGGAPARNPAMWWPYRHGVTGWIAPLGP